MLYEVITGNRVVRMQSQIGAGFICQPPAAAGLRGLRRGRYRVTCEQYDRQQYGQGTVITSYSIHYTKLYETRAALSNANEQLYHLQSSQQLQQQQASAESASLREQLNSKLSRDATHERLLYESITWAINQSSPYDIHEEAFSDRRLAIITELVSRLDGLGFRGTVQLESHLGEFCLAGSDAEGYSLAPPDLPVTECALIGHPLQDLPSLGERQSIAFSYNFV